MITPIDCAPWWLDQGDIPLAKLVSVRAFQLRSWGFRKSAQALHALPERCILAKVCPFWHFFLYPFPLYCRICWETLHSLCPTGTLPSGAVTVTSAPMTWWEPGALLTWAPSAQTQSSPSGGSSAKAWKTMTPSAPSATVSEAVLSTRGERGMWGW